MTNFKNTMEIFKLLPKTNCRRCNAPTCLAFAAAVFKGHSKLEECPYIEAAALEQHRNRGAGAVTFEDDMSIYMESLREKIRHTDLAEAAQRVGGVFRNGRLTIKIFGKDFSVDTQGNIHTDIHVNPWVLTPFFSYILDARGTEPRGEWVPFRELPGGREFNGLYQQRCEKPLKRVADTYTDLFEDMITLFNGREVEQMYESDISLVLHPFPKVPLLICYWKPEEELDSDFHLFFDATVPDNLDIRSVYSLAGGLAAMFEKLALRHGIQ